jgi:hypothetical protein
MVTILALAFLALPKTYAATTIFEDGFETGDFSLWAVVGGSPLPEVTFGEAHSGDYKAVFNAVDQYAEGEFAPAVDHALMRAYVMFKSFPDEGAQTAVIGLSNYPDEYIAEVKIGNDAGTAKWLLKYYDDSIPYTVMSEQQPPQLDTWYRVEVEAKTNTTTDAEFRIYIDYTELTDISQTSKNNSSQIDNGYLWCDTLVTRWYDDVAIESLGTIGAPTATTGVATSVSTSGATLNGMVNANGESTTVTFEYGLTAGYGTMVTAAQSPVTGSSNTPVSAVLSSLDPNTTYHFRVVAENTGGTVYGDDASFTTAAPLVVTGPASITYGSTGTITISGGSGTGAMSYSAGVSTGCSVGSSTGVISVINTTGSCNVIATKAADGTYNAQTSAAHAVTLNKLAVTLSGSRTYNGTTTAAAAILTITNKIDADDVRIASGSATLASANAGVQSITSMGSLALGGSKAGNYTLTGATGSVTINPLAVTLNGSRTYDGSTTAASAILTITNKVDDDNVNIASGSATLASADVGSRSITSMGTLALGGSKAGNYTLTGATGSVTINPLAVILNGTRTYDGTAVAAAAILTISNKVDDDDVNVTSGSATLASADVGTPLIVSMGTLLMGGDDAGNYTLTGASGAVTITRADQVPLIITGPASIPYGSTGTVTTSGGSGIGEMSYSAGTSTGCTVDTSTGVITVNSVSGTCKVTATKAADLNYKAITSPEFTVALTPLLIFLPLIVH